MLKPLLQVAAIVTVISLGMLSAPISAAPTNPWGSGDSSVVEQAQPQAAEPAAAKPAVVPEAAQAAAPEAVAPEAMPAAQDAKPVEQAANETKDSKNPKDPKFDPKAAKIDPNKVPSLEKPKEGKVVVARVVWVKGTFTAIEDDLSTRRELKPNSVIYLHDTLQTPPRSTAQIIFTDNASMTFRPDTVFHIDKYKFEKDPKKKGESKNEYVMDLVTGGFRTVTGLIAHEDPDSYAVKTPVATIGVRGTEYSVVYEEGGELFIQQYKGEPCLANQGSDGKKVCLNNDRRYGEADKQQRAPRVVVSQPGVFATDVEVVPVTFEKGTIPSLNSSGSGDKIEGAGSFCIQ